MADYFSIVSIAFLNFFGDRIGFCTLLFNMKKGIVFINIELFPDGFQRLDTPLIERFNQIGINQAYPIAKNNRIGLWYIQAPLQIVQKGEKVFDKGSAV